MMRFNVAYDVAERNQKIERPKAERSNYKFDAKKENVESHLTETILSDSIFARW
jgi:hypothetical protein